jgi:hypothetical protein
VCGWRKYRERGMGKWLGEGCQQGKRVRRGKGRGDMKKRRERWRK